MLHGSWFLPQLYYAISVGGKRRGERLFLCQSEAAERGAGVLPAARPCSPTGAQGLVRYTAPTTAR